MREATRNHHHIEIEFRGAIAVGLEQGERETRPAQRRHIGVVRAERDLEQRIASDLALRLQRAHHALERHFLVLIAVGQCVHRPRQQRAETRIARHARAHRDRIHEHAEHAFRFVRATIGDR